jgi:radical SAM protein with 4Fe4S-binding SPASM domain
VTTSLTDSTAALAIAETIGAAARARMDAKRPRRALPIFEGSTTRALEPAREEDGRYVPIIAVWEVTLRCDLACRHCASRAAGARPDELDTGEALDLVRQLAELGVREVTLIGGEAYLRDDWLAIVGAIRAHGMMATMVTGGRGLGRERARAAAAAGVTAMSVSIDGEARAHDRLRGPGSHAAALAALAEIRDAGMTPTVNTQVNRLTLPDLPAVLERIGAAGAKAWQVQITVPMGRAADDFDMVLQPHDLLALFPIVGELVRRGRELGVAFVPGNNLGYFGPYEHLLRGGMAGGHGGGCGAGKLTLGIEANGAVKGCPSLATDAWSGGTVREQPLQEIWRRASALRYGRDRTHEASWGFCASCYYEDACRAGCTWMSDSILGRPGNNPYCHHRALELRKAGRRERVERVEDARGAPFDRATFRLVEEAWPEPAGERESRP